MAVYPAAVLVLHPAPVSLLSKRSREFDDVSSSEDHSQHPVSDSIAGPGRTQRRASGPSGRRRHLALGELHLSYETCEEYPLRVEFPQGDEAPPEQHRLGTRKMRLIDDGKTLAVNEHVRLTGIPTEAHQNEVNGRTPLGWFIDRYHAIDVEMKAGAVVIWLGATWHAGGAYTAASEDPRRGAIFNFCRGIFRQQENQMAGITHQQAAQMPQAVRGFTNHDLRTRLQHTQHPASQQGVRKRESAKVSRILHRFHSHGLIAEYPHSRRWSLRALAPRL